MQLTPHTLYRFAEVVQTLEQLSSVTGTRPPQITVEVVLDDQPNAMVVVDWIEETEEAVGHFAITDLSFREEEPEVIAHDEADQQVQEILDRFWKNFEGVGGRVTVIDADSLFGAPEDDEELIAQAPVKGDGEQ